MRMKTIVKVMNFHSLIHIDAARRMTEKYIRMESEVTKMIGIIMNNRNFILDKLTLMPNENNPSLNIYIGSDFSFCGGLNSSVKESMMEDIHSEKIVVGRKLKSANTENVLLSLTKDEFDNEYYLIEEILDDSIRNLRHSSINIIYNHYYNAGNIELRKGKVFPIPLVGGTGNSTEDFIVEGQIDDLLKSLTTTYVSYEVMMASINSFASENVIRQDATTESLKKIDEIEEEEARVERKINKKKSYDNVFDSFVKRTVHRRTQ